MKSFANFVLNLAYRAAYKTNLFLILLMSDEMSFIWNKKGNAETKSVDVFKLNYHFWKLTVRIVFKLESLRMLASKTRTNLCLHKHTKVLWNVILLLLATQIISFFDIKCKCLHFQLNFILMYEKFTILCSYLS